MDALSPSTAKDRRRRNPFGKLAGLRISKKNYDRRRAARFKKGFARWLPHLAAWDATLRLVAGEARIRRAFKPGFVLDDELLGLTTKSSSGSIVIYLHPDRLQQVVKAHRERSLAIAAYLHGVACHELTHADGRMGRGHGEEFVTAREDLGHATSHLLPAIAVLVQNLLGLPVKPSEDALQVRKLERQLERAKASGKAARCEVKRMRRELDAAQAALVEAQGRSAEVRATCGRACADCVSGSQGGEHRTARTRVAFSTVAEWVEGWRALRWRRHSAARHQAEAAHLEALPDSVVAVASEGELVALEGVLAEVRAPRGRRAGHPVTRLTDAVDRRRALLGKVRREQGPDAARVVEVAGRALVAAPPAGVERAYVEGFLERNRVALVGMVRAQLEVAR